MVERSVPHSSSRFASSRCRRLVVCHLLLTRLACLVDPRVYQFPASNRTILLTGCDSGLGYATALHLHREGAQVIAACLTHEGARAIEAQAAKHQQRDTGGGGSFRTIMIDVTSPPSIEAAVTRMSELAPHGIDVLVNNAGTMSGSNLFDLTPLPTFQHTLDVNFFGVIRMCKALMPLLKRRARLASGVRIVNVSSFLGRVAPFSLAPYAASKFALEALSDVMRQELSGFNIQVVIVEPGAMKTNMAETMKREQRQGWDAGQQQQHQHTPTTRNSSAPFLSNILGAWFDIPASDARALSAMCRFSLLV